MHLWTATYTIKHSFNKAAYNCFYCPDHNHFVPPRFSRSIKQTISTSSVTGNVKAVQVKLTALIRRCCAVFQADILRAVEA